MDSVLILGQENEALGRLLKKVGYHLVEASQRALPEIIERDVVDLILIDSRLETDALSLCDFLRSETSTRDVPIIYLSDRQQDQLAIGERGLQKIEFVQASCSPGILLSKVALQLRLRKMAGGESDGRVSLGEMNAALRDLTERFTKELEEARAIQENLLPTSLPHDARCEIAALYQPLEQVGGDWYYVRSETSGAISFQIADVTGHGLSAALIGSMTKLAMFAAARENPGELVKEMNRLMAPQLPEGRFVTMGSFLYHPDTGTLEWTRAGHPPAILLKRREQKIQNLGGDGFALGFFEDSEYESYKETLEPGDIVLMITDGLSEAQNLKGELYGAARLEKSLIETNAEQTATEIVEQVLNDFDTFRDGRILKDDVTVVCLKRKA